MGIFPFHLGQANALQVIAVVTFVVVWFGKGVPTGRRVTLQLRIASAVVALTWLLVTALVTVPAALHSKASDKYWAPTPVRFMPSRFVVESELWI